MRNSVAKSLRKVIKYNPHNKRDYEDWVMTTKTGMIYRIMPDGTVETKEHKIDCIVRECVTPEYKVYKEAKRKYKDFKQGKEVSLSFNEIPNGGN